MAQSMTIALLTDEPSVRLMFNNNTKLMFHAVAKLPLTHGRPSSLKVKRFLDPEVENQTEIYIKR